jgi:hypothetical protein
MFHPHLINEPLIPTSHQPSDISRFTASPKGGQSLNKMLEAAMSLSDEIFDLQEVSPV